MADEINTTEAPAQAQSPWTTPGPVPFKVEFAYVTPTTQAATIVLTEDQSGEDRPAPREVRLPVTLRPAP